MNTDWEQGKPPRMLEVDAFAYGCVRRGWNRGDGFVLIDCTHPQQNMVLDLAKIDAWRARESIVVIDVPVSPYAQQGMNPSLNLGLGGIAASVAQSMGFF